MRHTVLQVRQLDRYVTCLLISPMSQLCQKEKGEPCVMHSYNIYRSHNRGIIHLVVSICPSLSVCLCLVDPRTWLAKFSKFPFSLSVLL